MPQTYHQKLESTSPGSLDLDKLEQELNQGKDLCDIARDAGLLTDTDEETHLRRDWYNQDGTGWWPTYNTVGIVRASYLELIKLIRAKPRSVRTVWVAGTGTFAISLDETPERITRIVMTPPVPTDAREMATSGAAVVHQVAGEVTIDAKPLKAAGL